MTDGPCQRLRLGRQARVRAGRDYDRAKAGGRRMAWGCMMANWFQTAPGSPTRVGVIASRRVGGAVVRNRARRLLREVFRRHQRALAGPLDLILIARGSIVGKSFNEVERDFLTGLRRARLGHPMPALPTPGETPA